ncbi:hypothetical protein SAXI111661_19670 [Saccharomonospora xinjiangensis]|nr:hypothetical protein EYD13_09180 [Saccharomonospora xinjiangensis]
MRRGLRHGWQRTAIVPVERPLLFHNIIVSYFRGRGKGGPETE